MFGLSNDSKQQQPNNNTNKSLLMGDKPVPSVNSKPDISSFDNLSSSSSKMASSSNIKPAVTSSYNTKPRKTFY